MCMKYINTTSTCYESVTIENNNIVSFNAPFNNIISNNDLGRVSIEKFSIVTQIDFLGTNNHEHAEENPLVQKKEIDFIIRLTKCNRIEEERLAYDLDKFSINLADMYNKGKVDHACFDFMNYTRITNVNQLSLPAGIGKYVIKVLIKYSEDTEYTIQSMTTLNIV